MSDTSKIKSPNVIVSPEFVHFLNKKPKDRTVVWPSNDTKTEKTCWTKELAEQALNVTRPRSEDK